MSSPKTQTILPLNIPPADVTHLSLRLHHNPDHLSTSHENSDLFAQIGLILELKLLFKMRPQGRPPGVEN